MGGNESRLICCRIETNRQEYKHVENIQNMGQKYRKFTDIGRIDYCSRPAEF